MNTMTTPPILTLQPGEMSFADLRRVWLAPTPIALSGDCAAAIEASAATVQAIVAKGAPAYGINTGFGLLAKTQIATHELERLQRNLILSHAVGTGEDLSDNVARLVLLMKAAKASAPSTLRIAGKKRTLSMVRLDDHSQPWDFAEVLARMEQVRAAPKQEIEAAKKAFAASRGAGGPPRLRLALDMPLGKVPIGGLPKDLAQVVVPPLQPLEHDAAFFAAIPGRGFHGGLLDGLAAFYE